MTEIVGLLFCISTAPKWSRNCDEPLVRNICLLEMFTILIPVQNNITGHPCYCVPLQLGHFACSRCNLCSSNSMGSSEIWDSVALKMGKISQDEAKWNFHSQLWYLSQISLLFSCYPHTWCLYIIQHSAVQLCGWLSLTTKFVVI